MVEISKSDGAVTTKFAVKRAPETVKLCSVEAVPEQAVKFAKDCVTETEGPIYLPV